MTVKNKSKIIESIRLTALLHFEPLEYLKFVDFSSLCDDVSTLNVYTYEFSNFVMQTPVIYVYVEIKQFSVIMQCLNQINGKSFEILLLIRCVCVCVCV